MRSMRSTILVQFPETIDFCRKKHQWHIQATRHMWRKALHPEPEMEGTCLNPRARGWAYTFPRISKHGILMNSVNLYVSLCISMYLVRFGFGHSQL